jgi:hypothetical protein
MRFWSRRSAFPSPKPQVQELLPAYLLDFREALLLAITFALGNLSVRCGLIDQASFVASMILVFARMQLPVGCPELIRDWIANERAKPSTAWGAATYSPSVVDKTLY